MADSVFNLVFLTVILLNIHNRFVRCKMDLYQTENLYIPFINQSNCHVHFIAAEVNLYFSEPFQYLRTNTFTVRNMQLIDYYRITDRNDTHIISIDLYEGLNKTYHILYKKTIFEYGYRYFYNPDPNPVFNYLDRRFISCFVAVIISSEECQERYDTPINDTIPYFPYLTAVQELKAMFYTKRYDFHFDPIDYKVIHVMTSIQTESLNNDCLLSGHLRRHFNYFVQYSFSTVLILELTKISIKLSVTEYTVQPIRHNAIFTQFCWHGINDKIETSSDFQNRKEVSLKPTLGQFEVISKQCKDSNIWLFEDQESLPVVNLDKYKQLRNVFILPLLNDLTFQNAIVSLLLTLSNATIPSFPIVVTQELSESYLQMYPRLYPEKRYSHDFSEHILFSSITIKLRWKSVPIRKFGYNFLTCYHENYRSWKYYLQPFEMEVWLVLMTYLSFVAIFVHVTVILRKQNNSDFNAFFYFYSTILEYAYSVPDYIFNIRTLETVIGLWLVMSVILTNAYKGIAITGITAPMEKASITSFYDILKGGDVDYKEILTTPDEQVTKTDFAVYTFLSTEGLAEWVDFNRTGNIEYRDDGSIAAQRSWVPFMLEAFQKASQQFNSLSSKSLDLFGNAFWRKWRLHAELNRESTYPIPKPEIGYEKSLSVAIEREIVNCSRKIMFVSGEENIANEIEYLRRNYPHKTFFQGNEALFSDYVTWQFDNPGGSRLIEYFMKLLENGIYHQIEWFYRRQEYSGIRLNYTRSQVEKDYIFVKPLDLHSNLQSIFYLYIAGIMASLISYVVERIMFRTIKVRNKMFDWLQLKLRRLVVCLIKSCGFNAHSNDIEVYSSTNSKVFIKTRYLR